MISIFDIFCEKFKLDWLVNKLTAVNQKHQYSCIFILFLNALEIFNYNFRILFPTEGELLLATYD